MFEAAVDGFGWAVGSAGVVEVGQEVPARRSSVLPSAMSLVGQLGTRVEVLVLISARIRALPTLVSGVR